MQASLSAKHARHGNLLTAPWGGVPPVTNHCLNETSEFVSISPVFQCLESGTSHPHKYYKFVDQTL